MVLYTDAQDNMSLDENHTKGNEQVSDLGTCLNESEIDTEHDNFAASATNVTENSKNCLHCSWTPHFLLACVAIWFFGGLLGFIALILEVIGSRDEQCKDPVRRHRARILRTSSYVVSVFAFLIGWLVVVVAVATLLTSTSNNSKSLIGTTAKLTTTTTTTTSSTLSSPDPRPHCAPSNGKCYKFRSDHSFSCASCHAVNGTFDHNDCYYDSSDCAWFMVNGHCFTSRRALTPTADVHHLPGVKLHCHDDEYNGDDGFCYFTPRPDCDGGYYIDCICYKYKSTNFTLRTCKRIDGNILVTSGEAQDGTFIRSRTCYYNEFNCSFGFAVNGQCYAKHSTHLTAGSCRNMKGFYANSTAALAEKVECYHEYDGCKHFERINGQCFGMSVLDAAMIAGHIRRVGGAADDIDDSYYYDDDYDFRKSAWKGNGRCSTCVNTGGVYILENPFCSHCKIDDDAGSSGSCYYYDSFEVVHMHQSLAPLCPYFMAGLRCEKFNDSALNETQCEDVDGFYDNETSTCYYTPFVCPKYSHNCRCYQHKSTTFDAYTCNNIEGSFVGSEFACYYNDLNDCGGYWFKGQCYARSHQYQSPEECAIRCWIECDNDLCYDNTDDARYEHLYGPGSVRSPFSPKKTSNMKPSKTFVL